MGLISDGVSIVCIIVGILSLLKYLSRKFNRTNAFGVEEFTSYSGKLMSKTKDFFLVGVAIFFTISGVMMLAFHYQDSWGWIVIIPAMLILYGIWIPGRR
jgi:hypothetical protein